MDRVQWRLAKECHRQEKEKRRQKRHEKCMHAYLRKQRAAFSSTRERGHRYLPEELQDVANPADPRIWVDEEEGVGDNFRLYCQRSCGWISVSDDSVKKWYGFLTTCMSPPNITSVWIPKLEM